MKVKSIVFCTVLLSAFCFSVNAQKSSAILKAGINLSNVSVTDNGKVDDAKMLTSFHVGIGGDVHLAGPLYFQPAILFTGKGTKSQSGDASSATYYKATSNPYYIEVPVNVVFKAPVGGGAKFFAGAGPYLAVGVAGKNKVEGKYLGLAFNSEKSINFSNDDPSTMNYEEDAGFGKLKRFDYGLNGTAGIEGKTMLISVNYGLGLAKLQSGSNSSANDNNKYRVLSFTVGLKL
jgi:Outer membrane protein beta-barrel domain